MPTTMQDLSESDFTSLYIASDKASKDAQKSYTTFIGIDLVTMIAASAIAIYNYQSVSSKLLLYVISGIFLLSSLLLTIILLTRKFEDTWYQGRALAESCKTLTWRFMTCSELFEVTIPLNEAKEKFISRIKELGNEFSELNKVLSVEMINQPIITSLMLQIRSSSLKERKEYYIKNRIEEQKGWYSKKANFNKRRYNLWFAIIITNQALSLLCITYLIVNPESNLNFVGLFTTISAAALSWLQLKKHQELKQAYTTTSQELNLIVALAEDIVAENEFSKFVLDSENAVSREHTLWLAQRRK